MIVAIHILLKYISPFVKLTDSSKLSLVSYKKKSVWSSVLTLKIDGHFFSAGSLILRGTRPCPKQFGILPPKIFALKW